MTPRPRPRPRLRAARARRDQLLPGEWDYGLFLSRDLGAYLGMTSSFMRELASAS